MLSKSVETGETAYKPVTDLIRDNERVIYDLRFEVRLPDGSTREARFETTDDHPWMSKDGQWLNTDQLNPGVGIQTAYGEAVTVKSVTNTGQTQPTFNLTVADFQTYFVGEDRIWVHNCDKKFGNSNDPPPPRNAKPKYPLEGTKGETRPPSRDFNPVDPKRGASWIDLLSDILEVWFKGGG